MLRPIIVRHYLNTMNSLGFDARDILVGTRIDCEALERPGYLVGMEQCRRIVENMARIGSGRGVGLDIGLGFDMAQLGPLGYASTFCQTPRQSMEKLWARYGEMFGVLSRPVFLPGDTNNTTFKIVTPVLTEPAYRFCIEEALGLIFKVGRMVAGRSPAFESIEFAFAPPPYQERYNSLFKCPISYESKETRATINRKWLEKLLPTADEPLSNFYQQRMQAARRHIENGMPLASRIRERLLHSDAGALPTLPEVARELRLSERTLCRNLQAEGLGYRKLVEEFRFEQAAILIRAGKASAKNIAHRLGFRDVNAFRRAFKKWTGQTVRRYKLGEQ